MAVYDAEYLTIAQACEMLQISPQTLARLRREGKIADWYPHGRPTEPGPRKNLVRIPRASVLGFIQQAEEERARQEREFKLR
jgi:hypothetical protein